MGGSNFDKWEADNQWPTYKPAKRWFAAIGLWLWSSGFALVAGFVAAGMKTTGSAWMFSLLVTGMLALFFGQLAIMPKGAMRRSGQALPFAIVILVGACILLG